MTTKREEHQCYIHGHGCSQLDEAWEEFNDLHARHMVLRDKFEMAVQHELCEACKLGVRECWHSDLRRFVHNLNGISVPCTASDWRLKMAQAHMATEKET